MTATDVTATELSSRRALQRAVAVLMALLLALAVGCGIDDDSDEEEEGGGTVPNISGTYTGFFFSQETSQAIPISQAVFIRVGETTFQADFDVDADDALDAVPATLELLLNAGPVLASVDTSSSFLIEASQGLVIMNGKVMNGTRTIEGDWLLNFFRDGEFLEDSGTWRIDRD